MKGSGDKYPGKRSIGKEKGLKYPEDDPIPIPKMPIKRPPA